jgi:hypothetical protein
MAGTPAITTNTTIPTAYVPLTVFRESRSVAAPPVRPVIDGSTRRILMLGVLIGVEETPITLLEGMGIQILLIGLPLEK